MTNIKELEEYRENQRRLVLSRAQQKRKWYDELSDEEREILPIRWR